jgi:hypothetical protein
MTDKLRHKSHGITKHNFYLTLCLVPYALHREGIVTLSEAKGLNTSIEIVLISY